MASQIEISRGQKKKNTVEEQDDGQNNFMKMNI